MNDIIEVRERPLARVAFASSLARVLDYLFGLLYSVLLVRLVLELINAHRGTGFYDFIASISDPFYAPFRGLLPTTMVAGAHVAWAMVAAIVGYMLLHAAIRGLLRLIVRD